MNSTLPAPDAPPSATARNAVAAERWGDFISLPENRSAIRAARSIAQSLAANRRPPFNPLVLHGAPGSGKTHLTAVMLREVSTGAATARTISAGDLARATTNENAAGFADADLTACDVLVVEDVQLLPARFVDALCELIDRRGARRKATVVTANVGPAGLRHFPRKFTSRLAAGLVVQLKPLSLSSRRAMLEAAAKSRKVRLTPDALDWLVGQGAGGGVRVLQGLIANLAPAARGRSTPFDRAAVEEILAGSGQPPAARRDVARIVKGVAAAFDVTPKELLGPSRLRRVLVPRHVAMYLARELCGLSLPRLGAAFGGRDHTTVLHACRKVEADLVDDAMLASVVRQLQSELA